MIIAATMATMMLATGTIITNVYKTEINPDVDDAKVLKLSKTITFVFAYLTLIPAFLIPLVTHVKSQVEDKVNIDTEKEDSEGE